jgi:Na+/H+ antiporter NhaB
MPSSSSRDSDTNTVFFAYCHALAPQTHSKNESKNQKNALFSLSVVALLSVQNSSNVKKSSQRFLKLAIAFLASTPHACSQELLFVFNALLKQLSHNVSWISKQL